MEDTFIIDISKELERLQQELNSVEAKRDKLKSKIQNVTTKIDNFHSQICEHLGFHLAETPKVRKVFYNTTTIDFKLYMKSLFPDTIIESKKLQHEDNRTFYQPMLIIEENFLDNTKKKPSNSTQLEYHDSTYWFMPGRTKCQEDNEKSLSDCSEISEPSQHIS